MQDTNKKMASARSVFRVYLSHTRMYTPYVVIVIISLIILQLANLFAPLFLRHLFNLLATGAPSAVPTGILFGTFGLVVLMWAIDILARRVQDFCTMYMQARAMDDLYDSAFDYLIRHSYNFFISRFAGSLTHRVTKFVRAYETLFDSVIGQFFPTTLFVIGAVTVLFLRNHLLGIALGVWCVIFVAFQVFVAK